MQQELKYYNVNSPLQLILFSSLKSQRAYLVSALSYKKKRYSFEMDVICNGNGTYIYAR